MGHWRSADNAVSLAQCKNHDKTMHLFIPDPFLVHKIEAIMTNGVSASGFLK